MKPDPKNIDMVQHGHFAVLEILFLERFYVRLVFFSYKERSGCFGRVVVFRQWSDLDVPVALRLKLLERYLDAWRVPRDSYVLRMEDGKVTRLSSRKPKWFASGRDSVCVVHALSSLCPLFGRSLQKFSHRMMNSK